MSNKKGNIENLQKKWMIPGLERASQKALDELILMKLLKSDSKNEDKKIVVTARFFQLKRLADCRKVGKIVLLNKIYIINQLAYNKLKLSFIICFRELCNRIT